jgi:hypothetical protein
MTSGTFTSTADIDFHIDVDASGTELVIVSDNVTTRHQVRADGVHVLWGGGGGGGGGGLARGLGGGGGGAGAGGGHRTVCGVVWWRSGAVRTPLTSTSPPAHATDVLPTAAVHRCRPVVRRPLPPLQAELLSRHIAKFEQIVKDVAVAVGV